MANRKRDYKAEYQRRIEKAQAAGLTRAQGRRGARKYAAQPPREHKRRAQVTAERYGATPREVTRQRLATKHIVRGEQTFNLQRFHSLKRAMDFAATLPDRNPIYIMGHGAYRNPTKYKSHKRGWASLSDFMFSKTFTNPRFRQEVEANDSATFDPNATTYEVRWRGPRT